MGQRLLSLALLLLLTTAATFGGAGFPIVKGAISKNGQYVVVIGYEYEPSESSIKRVKTITYQVQRRERFINNRFSVSNVYWSESVDWGLTIPFTPQFGTALPVISDDGKTIALLLIEPPFSKETEATRIYKKKDSTAELVGRYRLADIWSPEELRQRVVTLSNDGGPLWLDGATFEFSPLSDEFVMRTKSGSIVRIDVEQGTVLTR